MDKKLDNMSVLEKAVILESLAAKAENDVEYAIQVGWATNPQDDKMAIRVLIDNTRTLFQTGRIDSLDYDVRNEAIVKYQRELDKKLSMFPEYALLDQQDMSANRHM